MAEPASELSQLSLNTATLGHNLEGYGAGWSPEEVIDACAARGYGGLVFWRRELGDRAAQIGDRARAAGLRIDGLCRTPYLVGPGAPVTLDDARQAVEEAAALGAPVLTIVTGGTEPGTKGVAESKKLLAERIARLAQIALPLGVSLAIEPLNPMFGGGRTCVMTVRDALEVCRATGAANVGIAVDVYHVWWDSQLAESLMAAQGRLLGLHLCDWLEETRDMLLDRGMMGDGVADLSAIRAAMVAAGYDGPCEVEVFSANDWWMRPPEEVLDTVAERFRTVC